MHQQPTLSMAGNLRWTRNGVCWADFLLSGLPYRYLPRIDQTNVRSAHKMLMRALPGESLLLGITASISPAAVVERMTAGIDLETHQAWVDECHATLDSIGALGIGQRVYWLSVPLTSPSIRDQLTSARRSLLTSLDDFLGTPRPAVPEEEIALRARQADQIHRVLPAVFRPTPVTPAQMVWLWEHSLRRGLGMDPDIPDPAETPAPKQGSALIAARVDEGCQADRTRAWLPTMKRGLRIDTPYELDEQPASYQVVAVLADTPAGGTLFPGSEFFSLCDDIVVDGVSAPVDFAIRLRTRPGAEVMKKNRTALRNLNEQFLQREGELTAGRGVLDVAAEALSEYTTLLESDKQEIEVGWTATFIAGGSSAEEAEAAATALVKTLEAEEYRVVLPLGGQEDLWWASAPGYPTPQIAREYAQITTSGKFAAYVPVCGSRIGDRTGPLLALDISAARPNVVHYDVAARALRDVSGSLAVTGELGSGKSKTLKTIAGHVVDRGGQVVVVDQSATGEYARWAEAVTEAVVVDMVEADWSMDPLRSFPGQLGAEMAEAVLRALLRLSPHDPWTTTLSTVLLDPEYRRSHPFGGCGDLVDHLVSGQCAEPHAVELGKALAAHARRTYAAALFDPALPALPLTAPAIVFRTHQVELPTPSEIERPHLYEHLPPIKQFGAIVYSLIAQISHGVLYADTARLAVLVVDEADHLLTAAYGIELVTDIVLRGRKSNGAVALGDQDCVFGTDKLRGLIKTRVVHRHTDPVLARRALEWLQLDNDPDALRELMEDTSPVSGPDGYVEPGRRGEGFMRDSAGRVARVKILEPFYEPRAQAGDTTPQVVAT
jgi:energy-coupling factor transporter ATP-binding protein EcfA2